MTTPSLDGTPFALLERPRLIPGLLEDPYPFYARLRARSPIHHVPLPDDDGPGMWLVSSYAAILEAYASPDLSSDNLQGYAFQRYRAALPDNFVQPLGPRAMLNLDPPDHTRLRGLVNRVFTPRMVSGLRPRMHAICEELLAGARRSGSLDLVRDLAEPLPAIVIAEMLGLPAADHDEFRLWSSHLIGNQMQTDPAQSARSALSLIAYFRRFIAERRADPREDLLSLLVLAQDERGALNDDELLMMAMLILAAGHETTTNLIGNGALALLQHPDELARLREEPSLIPDAVEEMLRFDTPVHQNWRVAPVDTTLAGQAIPKGSTLVLLPGAGNRDPERFPEPDRFDVGRSDNNHLSFGFGRHFCLGASLTRAETQVAFSALLAMFSELRPRTLDPERRLNVTLRGPATLPVVVRPR